MGIIFELKVIMKIKMLVWPNKISQKRSISTIIRTRKMYSLLMKESEDEITLS